MDSISHAAGTSKPTGPGHADARNLLIQQDVEAHEGSSHAVRAVFYGLAVAAERHARSAATNPQPAERLRLFLKENPDA